MATDKPTKAGTAVIPFVGNFDELTTGARKAVGQIGSSLAAAFEVTVAGGVVAAGLAVVDLGVKYQKTTSQIQANANISAQAAADIGKAFLGTGGQVTQTGQQIEDAFAPVVAQLEATAGHALSAGDSLTFMKVAADLADASGGQLTETTAALSNVMAAFGLGVAQAAGASDILYNASGALNVPLSAVADMVDKLHGKLGIAAPSLADTGALIEELAQQGLTGTRGLSIVSSGLSTLLTNADKIPAAMTKANTTYVDAVTKLNALERSTKTSTSAIDAQKVKVEDAAAKMHLLSLGVGGLGLTVYDAAGKFVGMDSIITQLQPKLVGMTQQQQLLALTTLFGKASAEAMLGVILKGPVAFDANAAAVSRAGSAHQAAVTATDNLQGSFDRLKSKVIDSATSFGQQLLPDLTGVMDYMSTTGFSALEGFGGFLLTDIINPGINIAKVVIPPILDVLSFFSQHLWLVEGAAAALLVRFIAIKTLGLVEALATMGAAFVTFAGEQGVGSAVMAIAGLGGSGGFVGALASAKVALAEVGDSMATAAVATTASMGQMELDFGGMEATAVATSAGAGIAFSTMLLPIAAAAAAIGLIFDVGGIRTKIANFFAGTGDDAQAAFVKMATSSDKAGMDIVLGTKRTSDSMRQDFQDAQGYWSGLWDSNKGVTDRFMASFATIGTEGQAIISTLADNKQWDTLKRVMAQATIDGGNFNTALHDVANQGDQTAGALTKSMSDASYAIAADWERVRRASLAQNDDAVSGAYTAWVNIENAYGKGSERAADYLKKNLTVAQQNVIADIETIAAKLGITTDQVIQFGQDGTLSYNHVTGSVAQVTGAMDLARQAAADAGVAALVASGKYATLAAEALIAADNMRAVANLTPRGTTSGGGIQASHGAVVNAPLSGMLATLHGVEAVLPQDKASPWLWQTVVDAIADRPPSLDPMGRAAGAATPHASGGVSGRPGISIHAPVSIVVHGMTADDVVPAIRREIGNNNAEIFRRLQLA